MLVLTRRIGESVHIGDDLVVTVLRIGRHRVSLGFDAPDDVNIVRDELLPDDTERAATDPACQPVAS